MDSTESAAVRQRNAATELITNGRIWSAVWYLAWPTALNTLIQTAYSIINGAFVGHLPNATRALAAVGLGFNVLMIQFGFIVALSVGASALVARFLGAGQHEDADEATRQSLILCVLGGALTGLPMMLFSRPIARLIGASPGVEHVAADYTAVIAWVSIPMFLYMMITTVLRSAGDVKSPLYMGAIVLSLNAVFDWLLIYGIGPFPMMGVHGAALATCISRVAAVFLSFWFLKRSALGGALSHFRIHWGWFGRIMNIGWPAAIQNLLWSTASAGFFWILSKLPAHQVTPAQAAFTVGVRIESIAFMAGVAYSMAATPLVGQNLGAGKPDRAERTAWAAVTQAVLIMTAVAVGFFALPRWLALAFTSKAAVVPLVVSYLRINAISEPFLAIGMVLRGALQGAGDTRVPAVISVATLWLIRLPLAYLLSVPLGLGVAGAWASMSVTTFLSGILVAAWFKWGTWRTQQV